MQLKMKTFLTAFLLLLAGGVAIGWGMAVHSVPTVAEAAVSKPAEHAAKADAFTQLYDKLNLDSLSLSREAFLYAVQGYESLKAAGELKNDRVLSIVDLSLPSDKKRLYIIDMIDGKLLFNTYVSHGRNSGDKMATRFSNRPESFQTSLGFYITGDTYRGEHGYSLKLDGQERGINDNALMRRIVIHGASYVNERYIAKKGFIGRSLGCPAIPMKLHKSIINAMRDGSCLFLYSPDNGYLAQSGLLTHPLKTNMLDTAMADMRDTVMNEMTDTVLAG